MFYNRAPQQATFLKVDSKKPKQLPWAQRLTSRYPVGTTSYFTLSLPVAGRYLPTGWAEGSPCRRAAHLVFDLLEVAATLAAICLILCEVARDRGCRRPQNPRRVVGVNRLSNPPVSEKTRPDIRREMQSIVQN